MSTLHFADLPHLLGLALPAPVQPRPAADPLDALVWEFALITHCSPAEARARMQAALALPPATASGYTFASLLPAPDCPYRPRPPRRLARRAHAKRMARRSA